jgi:hypothetical protein
LYDNTLTKNQAYANILSMSRKQEIPDHAVNLSPTIMAQAIVARATPHNPAYGLRIAEETGLSQGTASKILSGMKTAGLAESGERAKFLPSGRVADPSVGTELLQQEMDENVHLSRAAELVRLAERMGGDHGKALELAIACGHAALDAQESAVLEQQPVPPQA